MDLRERPNSPENQCNTGFQPVFCPIERRFPNFHRSFRDVYKDQVLTPGISHPEGCALKRRQIERTNDAAVESSCSTSQPRHYLAQLLMRDPSTGLLPLQLRGLALN